MSCAIRSSTKASRGHDEDGHIHRGGLGNDSSYGDNCYVNGDGFGNGRCHEGESSGDGNRVLCGGLGYGNGYGTEDANVGVASGGCGSQGGGVDGARSVAKGGGCFGDDGESTLAANVILIVVSL